MIGDVNHFEDEGKLAAYLGIVPRVSNSNETEHSGRITKHGSKLDRTALVQCALIAQRYSPYLKRYYEKIKARRVAVDPCEVAIANFKQYLSQERGLSLSIQCNYTCFAHLFLRERYRW